MITEEEISKLIEEYKASGLLSIVCEQFEFAPRDKVIFAFCINARNRIKMLVWADNGFWIHF